MLNQVLSLLRIYHQVSQTSLAKYLEISNSHLSEIEHGIKTPSIELLTKYSKTFTLPLSSIFFFAELIEASLSDTDPCDAKYQIDGLAKINRMINWIDECKQLDISKLNDSTSAP